MAFNVDRNPLKNDLDKMTGGVTVMIPNSEVFDGERIVRAAFLRVAKWMNPNHEAANKKRDAELRRKLGASVKGKRDPVKALWERMGETEESAENDRILAETVFLGWLMDGTVSDPEHGEIEVDPWVDDGGHPFDPTFENRLKVMRDPTLKKLYDIAVVASRDEARYAVELEEEALGN